MDIKFKTTTYGLITCSYNNVRLHSFYNPEKEAERFANTAQCDFNPGCVLVTEPAVSYCLEFLKKRFSKARMCCIRFTRDFDDFNKGWDKVFYACNTEGKLNTNLSEEIFSFSGEEGIASTLFLPWKASDQAFPEVSSFAWSEIKKAVLKSRSVLGTRNYFARRWTKNALRFSLFVKNTAGIKKGTSDILICASGPSLKTSIPLIKKYKDRFYLIAVSSALAPLVKAGIFPDLCISTDGGYYAKEHISFALNDKSIPLALADEGSCYGSIFNHVTVVPLLYGDGTSEAILKESGFNGIQAVRNGSVSGTALFLALNLTSGNVYYCGLDLAYSKGHIHTQPNELEINDSRFDSRLRTTETRISASVLNKGSIDIYRSWFSSQDFKGRVFRLSSRYSYSSGLGKIADIDWEAFAEKTGNYKNTVKPQLTELNKTVCNKNKIEILKDICLRNSKDSQWIHNAVPSEAVVMDRTEGTEFYEEARKTVEDGMKEFLTDIKRAFEK